MGSGRTREGYAARLAARASGATRYFTGLPCPRGHIAERQTANATCVECLNEKFKLRATPEWQQSLADYLNLIAGWTQDQGESDAVFYHEKCLVYTALLDLVPPGPQNDKILADYVDFVSNSNLYQQSPAEWFVEPHALMERSLTNPAQHAKLLEAYQNSGNPVLALAVALEKNFSTK